MKTLDLHNKLTGIDINNLYMNHNFKYNDIIYSFYKNINNIRDVVNMFYKPEIETELMFVTHASYRPYCRDSDKLDISCIRIRVQEPNLIRLYSCSWKIEDTANSVSFMCNTEISTYSANCTLFLYHTLRYILGSKGFSVTMDKCNIHVK